MSAEPVAVVSVPPPPMTPSAPATGSAAESLPPMLSQTELEDLLYDILATGADPNLAPGTLEAVQEFVHEHARAKKSQGEFQAFFEAHGLSMTPESPTLLALPPVAGRGRATETPLLAEAPRPPDPPLATPAAGGGGRVWLWSAAFAAATALGALGYLGTLELHAEMQRMRAESAESAAELARVRLQAEQLRAQLRESAQVMQRVEHKSDLLLQSFASPLDAKAR